VAEGVHDWEEQKRREDEAKKEEQSIWETTSNETSRVAGVRTPEEQAALDAEPEPKVTLTLFHSCVSDQPANILRAMLAPMHLGIIVAA